MIFMRSKGQADILSAVIIVIIALSLVSTAYMWGIPLIEKRQHTALVERAAKYFDRNNVNSLASKIEYIAKYGGETTFSLDIDGTWFLCPYDEISPHNNSIQFTFFSKVSNIAEDYGWIPNTCGSPPGELGIDDPSIVCARADTTGTGYSITYKIWFRELDESPEKGYKIVLVPRNEEGPFISTTKSIRISYGSKREVQQAGKRLIITEIKILL